MRIGMRNIKTAISVLICLLIYIFIILIAFWINSSWERSIKIATQLYTPFFACLAAAYSVSSNRTKSIGQAQLRFLASLIGGLFGLVVVAIYQATGHEWPFQHISATGNPTYDKDGLFQTGFLEGNYFDKTNFDTSFILSFIIPIIMVAVSVVIVIWFCNLIKKKECCFIAVLTLTAVTCSLGTNPIIYGPNRILSTMIGIVVALVVNLSRHHKKNDSVKLVFSLDGMYLKDKDKLSGYNLYQMEKLVEEGADLSLFTTRTPSTVNSMINETKITNPIICMSGAAIYNFKSKEYTHVKYLSQETVEELNNVFAKFDIDPFVSKIEYNTHYIYTKALENDAKKDYFYSKKDQAYVSINISNDIAGDNIVYYMILDKSDVIDRIEEEIKSLNLSDIIMFKLSSAERNEKYSDNSYLKIYSKDILDISYLKNEDKKIVYSFTSHKYDYILSQNTNENINVNLVGDEKIDKKNIESLFRRAEKIYRKKVSHE